MLHPKTKKNLLVVNNMLILKSLKQIDFRKKQKKKKLVVYEHGKWNAYKVTHFHILDVFDSTAFSNFW